MSTTALLLCAGLMAGCASSPLGSAVQTSSVDPNAPKVAAAAVAKPDPACVALLAKIDGIRKDGVTERAEQAAQGRSTTVPVKRASLGQLAELSKANAEYQSKCSAPGLKSAYVAPVVAPAAPPAPTAEKTDKVAKAAKKAVAKPVAAAKPVVSQPAVAAAPAAVAPVAAAVTVPTPAPAQVAAPAVAVPAPVVQAATAAAPAVVASPGAAVVQAAKQAATTAATSAASQVTPMPNIPGVSVAGQ